MGTLVTIVLIGLAVLLFLAAKIGWIHNETLQIGANVAAIVALLAAVLIYIVPVPDATPSIEQADSNTTVSSQNPPPSSTNELINDGLSNLTLTQTQTVTPLTEVFSSSTPTLIPTSTPTINTACDVPNIIGMEAFIAIDRVKAIGLKLGC